MSWNKNIVLYLAVVMLASCAAHFDRYPGEKLQEFPQAVQGEYYFATKPFFISWFKKDSAMLRIIPKGIVPITPSKQADALYLSDSVVLSSLGKYYALSQYDENIPGAWTVSILRVDRNTISAWVVEENKGYAKQLLTQFISDTYVRNNESNWNKVNTTADVKQRAMKNSHSDTAIVFKMNEPALIQLFEKQVSRERPIVLKRFK